MTRTRIVRTTGLALVATLLLAGCSGGKDEEGDKPGADSSPSASVAGTARTDADVRVADGATVTVRGKAAYLLVTVKNSGKETIHMVGATANAFAVSEIGDLQGRMVRPHKGGVELEPGKAVELGAEGVVVRLRFPLLDKKKDARIAVQLLFDDGTSSKFEAVLDKAIVAGKR